MDANQKQRLISPQQYSELVRLFLQAEPLIAKIEKIISQCETITGEAEEEERGWMRTADAIWAGATQELLEDMVEKLNIKTINT